MVNDSIQAPLNSVELFDQDSFEQEDVVQDVVVQDAVVQDAVQSPFVTAVVQARDGSCQECHVGNCGKCSDPDCRCPHPFVVIGRAIVELDGSLQRTNELLKKIEASHKTPEPILPIAPVDHHPVTPTTHVPAKARRGLGRKKSNR